jgi:MFS family permease
MRLASQPTNGNTYQHCNVDFLLISTRKLFVLNGFGYAVDSLILLIQSIIAGQAALEFKPGYPNGLTIAAYVGMLVGALFWGIGADIIGRKIAFNVSLVICSIFAIVAGASPSWEVLGLFVCLSAFGAGGNLVLDTAVFLEYLPGNRQFLLTLMAAWWGMFNDDLYQRLELY